MSFGGQSNQWQRSNVGQLSSFQPQQMPMFLQQSPQQQANIAFGNWPGSAGSVSYPQPRTPGLNPVAFQQTPAASAGSSGPQAQHYNSIGTVTKINSDCGLVNDEVFFYRNVCKGHVPKLGDRVLFEATFSSTGQFKWNATRIQLMPQQIQPQPLMGNTTAIKGSSGYNAVPPPNEYQRAQQMQRHSSPSRRLSPSRDRHARSERERRDRERIHRSRDRDEDEHDRKRRRGEDHGRSRDRIHTTANRTSIPVRSERDRERDRGEREEAKAHDYSAERKERDRDREREREREREKDRVERIDRSPHRSAVKGRRTRQIRRYMVQIPKSLLSYKEAGVPELRQRYNTLYVPSDFFHANIKWSETFTPDNAFSLRRSCQFHIMHRIVETPYEQLPEELEPADADYLYSAKVMLMACPPIAELYQKCFEDDDSDNEQNTVHPSRLISFLVGTRGRNEPMAIGGPWSASLDGENPDKDPAVLIRTAIRTCKALTGIDLSNCTQWYRFVELYYHRTEYKHKEKDGPPRVETVIIYLPDVHSCMPNVNEWKALSQVYKTAVENVIVRKTTANKGSAAAVSSDEATGTTTLANNSLNAEQDAAEADSTATGAVDGDSDLATAEITTASADGAADADAADKEDAIQEVPIDGDDNESNEKEADQVPQPTHYSKLDLKTMKVQDIRNELTARNLSAKGVRNMVMARLAKAINGEKAEAKIKNSGKQQLPGDSTPAAGKATPEKKVEKTAPMQDQEKDAANEVKIKQETKADNAEEQDDWTDVIDVDMSDIVILDEYDSSKIPEEPSNEIDEKEKNQLIRRYTLPSAPHVVVHPNKSAKGGKFDCSVMSLSVLLDYRPEDTKERFFEVSLFAELFNEMLMRDFGFNIYKELYRYKGAIVGEAVGSKDEEVNNKKNEARVQEDDEKSKESTDNKSNTDPASEKSSRERRASKRSLDDEPEDDNQSIKSVADRKRRTTNTTSVGSGKDKESCSDKKMIVVKPQLLLSFVYFDTSHCGYIFEKDLEDLFSILDLNLSRGQTRKILGKLATRQAFYYRKLTDKEDSPEATQMIEDADDMSAEEVKKISLGNRQYASIFKPSSNEDDSGNCNVVSGSNENDGLVNYNGAVVHVGKLLAQIKRTEKNLSDLEQLHNDLSKQHADLQKQHSRSSCKIKDLHSEVKSLTRKLSDADLDLFSVNRKYKDQLATLQSIYNRVAPYFAREKDKEHKSENSRDKDGDKEKEKEKEIDKEKETEKENEKVKEKDKDKNKNDRCIKEKEKNNKDAVKNEEKHNKNGEHEKSLEQEKSDVKAKAEKITEDEEEKSEVKKNIADEDIVMVIKQEK